MPPNPLAPPATGTPGSHAYHEQFGGMQEQRIVSPLVTGIIQGYSQNGFVGSLLFPRVDVTARTGKVLVFGREAFRNYNARRAWGANIGRIRIAQKGNAFELEQDALAGELPVELGEEVKNGTGVDMMIRSGSVVMDALTLKLEMEQAALAADPASYEADQSISVQAEAAWNLDTVNPIPEIEAAMELIRSRTGKRPNVLVLGPKPSMALRNNPFIQARYANTDGPVSEDQIARLFRLEKVVTGEAVYCEGDDSPMQDVWGNLAVLVYSPQKPENRAMPSFGYTYTMAGNPLALQRWWDGDTNSWISPITYERLPVVTGKAAGFLFRNPWAAPAAPGA